jgi:hypothetical protein
MGSYLEQYEPSPFAGGNLDSLRSYIENELRKLAEALKMIQSSQIKLQAQPAKVYDGLLAYADGTNWNPGGGEGLYMYYNSTWNKLG